MTVRLDRLKELLAVVESLPEETIDLSVVAHVGPELEGKPVHRAYECGAIACIAGIEIMLHGSRSLVFDVINEGRYGTFFNSINDDIDPIEEAGMLLGLKSLWADRLFGSAQHADKMTNKQEAILRLQYLIRRVEDETI